MDLTPSIVRCLATPKADGNTLSGAEVLVWLWYAAKANARGRVRYVRVQDVAKELELPRETVSRARSVLVSEQLLEDAVVDGKVAHTRVTDPSRISRSERAAIRRLVQGAP